MDRKQAEQLAEEWYAAWNDHDLERILSHYSDDVVFVSPFAVEIAGRTDGRLEGKEALRAYFGAALERFPDLKFEPIALMVGIDSLVLPKPRKARRRNRSERFRRDPPRLLPSPWQAPRRHPCVAG
jgi:ketosteroid isomerase-like protein